VGFEANPFPATTKKSIDPFVVRKFSQRCEGTKAHIHDLRLLTRQSLLLSPLPQSPLSGFAPTFGVKDVTLVTMSFQWGATKSYKWYNGITPLIKWPKMNMVTEVNYFTPIIGVRGPYL